MWMGGIISRAGGPTKSNQCSRVYRRAGHTYLMVSSSIYGSIVVLVVLLLFNIFQLFYVCI